MKITEQLKNAIDSAVKAAGNRNQFALKVGVAQNHVKRWVEGESESISDRLYEKIFPAIQPYLGTNYPLPWNFILPAESDSNKSQPSNSTFLSSEVIRNTPELREVLKDRMRDMGIDYIMLNKLIGYDSAHTMDRLLSGKLEFFPSMLSAIISALDLNPDDCPMTALERTMLPNPDYYKHGAGLTVPVPIYTTANAATSLGYVDGCVAPIMKKWNPETTDTISLPVSDRKFIPVRVDGPSMEPILFDGDVVLCEPCQKPRNGRIAVCKFRDDYVKAPGLVAIKVFQQDGDDIFLTSYNQKEGRNYPAKISDFDWIMRAVRKVGDL